ncbi:MAG: NAD(P)-dependent oxidoreductase [Coriobacteriia bacterium]|jgi:3-hydroxyisobutyrate dehydrogenase|nr:NAD(P)-dependent oxidoreductase [Coriobacteriia bacterium]
MVAPNKTRVGFVGTGVMGGPMAGHALAAGYEVAVFTRTREKAASLLESGAEWASSVAELAERCDVVVTMVGYPADVEEVYLGEEGLVAHAHPGMYLIDCTTSSPALAARIATEAASRGVHALDAPVTGGDVGAREARLSIMVGGSAEDFLEVEALLKVFGATVIHQGPAGSGQHTKMANQLAIAASMIGAAEVLGYAKASGLDPERVLRSVSAGSAGSWSLTNLAPRMLAEDFAPGFYVKHFVKDLRIALESAAELGIELPGGALALRLYESLVDAGYADEGTQAIWRLYRDAGK